MFISSMISTVFAATMTSTFVSTPMISSASSSSSLKVNAFQQLTATTHLMIVNSNKSRSSEHRSCFGVVLAASKQASNNNDDDDNDIPLASPPHQKIKKRRFRKFMGAFLLSSSLLSKSKYGNEEAWAAPAVSLRPGVTTTEITSKTIADTREDAMMDMDALRAEQQQEEDTPELTKQELRQQRRQERKQLQKKKAVAVQDDWDYDEDDDFGDSSSSSLDDDEDDDVPSIGSSTTSTTAAKKVAIDPISGQPKVSPPKPPINTNLVPKSAITTKSQEDVNKVLTWAIPVPIVSGLFIRETFKWRKEQMTVEKSIQVVREAEKKFFNVTDLKDVGKNLTAVNETLGNATDAEGGENGGEDGDDDDDDDDDGDLDDLPPSSPRRPTRGGGGGGNGGSPRAGGGGGGNSDGGSGDDAPPPKRKPPRPQPSQDDLDRLNRMFKNS